MGVAVKKLRIGRRRGQAASISPLELAFRPAFVDGRWQTPDRFNFARDVVEALATDPKRQALTCVTKDGVIEPRTFLQLAERSSRWATALKSHDVLRGDCVLVLLDVSLSLVEVVLGCLKVGAVPIPTSPGISAAALEARLATTGAVLVVANPASESHIVQLSFTQDVLYVQGEGHVPRRSEAALAPTEDTAAQDVALLLWTSGMESTPKPVAHTHGATFAARLQAEHWLGAGEGDVAWCATDSGSALMAWQTLFGTWARGAEVVVQESRLEPVERADLARRLGTTVLCLMPSEYRALAGLRNLDRLRPPSLRRLVSTGDRLDPDVVAVFEEAWGLTIHDGYGQTETNVITAAAEGAPPDSIGRALPGLYVSVVDDTGNELPPGIEGNLAVRGRPPTLFAGYWERSDETRRSFLGDWYVTGDYARADEEGTLWFVGRSEDVITSRGRTFGPYEVEHALVAHEAVSESAVIGVRDLERGGQYIRAFVVLAPGVEGTEQLQAEIRHFADESLPEQQVPREIEFVDELPTSPTGAVSRAALRAQPVAGRPLWELPPTSEPEPPPTVAQLLEVVQPPTQATGPTVVAEPQPGPFFVVEPVEVDEPAVQPTSESVVMPEPVIAPVPPPQPEAPPAHDEPPASHAPEFGLAPVPEAVEEVRFVPETEPVSETEPVQQVTPATEAEPVQEVPFATEAKPVHEIRIVPDPEVVSERKPAPEAHVVQDPEPVPAPEAPPSEVVDAPFAFDAPFVSEVPILPEAPSAPDLPSVFEVVSAPEAPATPEPPAETTPADDLPAPIVQPEAEVAVDPPPAWPGQIQAPPPPRQRPDEAPPTTTDEPADAGTAAAAEPVAAEPPPARPEPSAPPEPLPDYIVDPALTLERLARQASPPPPEPEPEPELGPLPEYVVDPQRRLKPVGDPGPPPAPQPDPVAASQEGAPTLEFPSAGTAYLGLPPVTSGPVDERKHGRGNRSRTGAPPPESDRPKRERSENEPGDDVETDWMRGLSSRLSAYGLSSAPADDEPPESHPAANEDEQSA